MGLFDFFRKKKSQRIETPKTEHKPANYSSQQNSTMRTPNVASMPNCSIRLEPKKSVYYNLEDIRSMRMGESLMIAPYDAGWLLQAPDSQVLPLFANSEKIRRFLPGLGFETEETCRKQLEAICIKTEGGLGFTYFIRLQNFPIGMITINSPIYNEKTMNLRIWSVDFFIAEQYEHQGLMFNALVRVLNQLKAMGANFIYALVDVENTSCIRLLQGLFKDEIENTHFASRNPGEDKPRVFVLDLSTINFQRS